MASRIRAYFERISQKYSAFLDGMGGLEMWGYYSKPSWMKEGLTPEQQDALAIRGDWENVGGDLEKSVKDNKKK